MFRSMPAARSTNRVRSFLTLSLGASIAQVRPINFKGTLLMHGRAGVGSERFEFF